jgi:hypothetical protein
MKKIKSILFIFSAILFVSCSSSNDDNSSTPDTSTLIAKWGLYSSISSNGTETPCNDFPNCKIMEFKTNGTLLFTEWNDFNIMTYTIDDDILDVKWQNGNHFYTYRIIQLDNQYLKLDLLDGRKNYYRKIN